MDLTAPLPSSHTFKRDHVIVWSVIVVLSLLSWLFIFSEARGMNKGIALCCITKLYAWTPRDFFFTFLMWAVMMIAMMVPSASPMILMFTSVNRQRREKENPFVPTWIFLLGYIAVWTGFSVAATFAQWHLHEKTLLSPMMVATSPIFGGVLLIVAGIFQFTPLKNRCLSYCQTPLSFLMTSWREGKWGAFLMGLRHGAFCTGCCWALMALLFVLGVMNIFWIGVISIFVSLEKISPKNWPISQISGILLILWGVLMSAGRL